MLCGVTIFAQQGHESEDVAAEPAKRMVMIPFDQAVAKSAANQPLILQAEAAVQAAETRVGQARSEDLPQLTAQAGYDYLSPKQYLDLGSESVQIVPENAYDFHLTAGILVYDFGKQELKVKLAQNAVSSALIEVDLIKQNIAYETAGIYYGLLFLKEEVQGLDEQIATLNKHLETTKKKESEGTTTHLDVLSTQIRITKTTNKRIDTASTLAKQKIALRRLMGLAIDTDYDVTGNFAQVQEARDEQTLIAIALANRPEMQAALKAENAEALGRSLAGLSNYPSISVQGEAGYKNGLLPATNQDVNALTFNWEIGVLLTMPIFDGFRAEKKKDEADAKIEAAHQGSDEQRQTITMQVLEALQDLSASHAQVLNAQAQVEQAQESLNMTQIRYDFGSGTNTDYLDALEMLSGAKIDNFSAQLKEALSGLALREALGEKIWIEK
jgi:outer membrane protein TolC